jgi:hypothetical protein
MSGSHEKKSPGKSGVLTNVSLSRVTPITTCYLTIQFEDESYMGTVLCKDSTVCQNLYQALQKNLGKSLDEIADLDLPVYGRY